VAAVQLEIAEVRKGIEELRVAFLGLVADLPVIFTIQQGSVKKLVDDFCRKANQAKEEIKELKTEAVRDTQLEC